MIWQIFWDHVTDIKGGNLESLIARHFASTQNSASVLLFSLHPAQFPTSALLMTWYIAARLLTTPDIPETLLLPLILDPGTTQVLAWPSAAPALYTAVCSTLQIPDKMPIQNHQHKQSTPLVWTSPLNTTAVPPPLVPQSPWSRIPCYKFCIQHPQALMSVLSLGTLCLILSGARVGDIRKDDLVNSVFYQICDTKISIR